MNNQTKAQAFAVLLAASLLPQSAAAFSFTFDWNGLKLCTSGKPNRVKSPVFVLKDVPDGTKYIRFILKDRDASNYKHGGGVVTYKGGDTVKSGAFKYKSPCPPSGSHTYEWTAVAKSKKKAGKIKAAKSRMKYP